MIIETKFDVGDKVWVIDARPERGGWEWHVTNRTRTSITDMRIQADGCTIYKETYTVLPPRAFSRHYCLEFIPCSQLFKTRKEAQAACDERNTIATQR